MATTAMSTYARSILVKEGMHPTATLRVDGTDIFPGLALTAVGETLPDVGLPDAISDSVIGVAGLLETQDIGTVYADNTEIPVYLTGSGAQVRMYHKGTAGGGNIVAGDILVADGLGNNGYVVSLAKQWDAVTVGDHTATVLATTLTILYSIVGRALETHASAAAVTPIKVMLSI